jgi:hypothetical protein
MTVGIWMCKMCSYYVFLAHSVTLKCPQSLLWVPVRCNWRVYVKFVGTLPFRSSTVKTGRVQCKFLCLYGSEKTTNLPKVADKLYRIMLYRVHPAWTGFKLTMLVMIDTGCIGSCKSKYHMITAMTVYNQSGIKHHNPSPILYSSEYKRLSTQAYDHHLYSVYQTLWHLPDLGPYVYIDSVCSLQLLSQYGYLCGATDVFT